MLRIRFISVFPFKTQSSSPADNLTSAKYRQRLRAELTEAESTLAAISTRRPILQQSVQVLPWMLDTPVVVNPDAYCRLLQDDRLKLLSELKRAHISRRLAQTTPPENTCPSRDFILWTTRRSLENAAQTSHAFFAENALKRYLKFWPYIKPRQPQQTHMPFEWHFLRALRDPHSRLTTLGSPLTLSDFDTPNLVRAIKSTQHNINFDRRAHPKNNTTNNVPDVPKVRLNANLVNSFKAVAESTLPPNAVLDETFSVTKVKLPRWKHCQLLLGGLNSKTYFKIKLACLEIVVDPKRREIINAESLWKDSSKPVSIPPARQTVKPATAKRVLMNAVKSKTPTPTMQAVRRHLMRNSVHASQAV